MSKVTPISVRPRMPAGSNCHGDVLVSLTVALMAIRAFSFRSKGEREVAQLKARSRRKLILSIRQKSLQALTAGEPREITERADLLGVRFDLDGNHGGFVADQLGRDTHRNLRAGSDLDDREEARAGEKFVGGTLRRVIAFDGHAGPDRDRAHLYAVVQPFKCARWISRLVESEFPVHEHRGEILENPGVWGKAARARWHAVEIQALIEKQPALCADRLGDRRARDTPKESASPN